MWMPRDSMGKPVQYGDVNICVYATDVLPIRKIQSFGPERCTQFQQRIGRAHFFERNQVGIHRLDAFADFGFGFIGLDEVT